MNDRPRGDERAINARAVNIKMRDGADTGAAHRIHPHAVGEDRRAPLYGGHAEGGNIEEDEVRLNRARVNGIALPVLLAFPGARRYGNSTIAP